MKKGVLLVLAGAALWGALPIFTRFAYNHGADAITASAWRSYIAAAVYLVLFLVNGTLKTLQWREVPFYLAYGLLGVSGASVLYMLAVQHLSTAMAATLLYTAPAFVILLDRILYCEAVTRAKLLSLGCTLLGCFLVVRGYNLAAFSASVPGILLGVGAGFCYAMITVMGRTAVKKHPPPVNAGLMMLFGTLPFLFLRPPWQLAAPTAPLLGSYLGMALVSSVVAFWLYLRGLSTGIDGGIASLIATAEPIVSVLLAWLIFGDRLEPLQMAGVAVVVLGISLPLWGAGRAGCSAQP